MTNVFIPTNLRALISQEVGIVRLVTELANAPDDARLFNYSTESTDLTFFNKSLENSSSSVKGHHIVGGASHISKEAAVTSAICEVVERYCAAFASEEKNVFAFGDNPTECVNPEKFALFHNKQYLQHNFRFRPFNLETTIAWVEGIDLRDGRKVLLPRQLVYLGPPDLDGEIPIAYGTSSGLACGQSFEAAMVSAILEAVERDAFMVAWHAGLSLPHVNWQDDPYLCLLEDKYFKVPGISYKVIDASAFCGIPVMFTFIKGGKSDCINLVAGAAAGLTAQEAWLKAMREVFQCRNWARYKRAPGDFEVFATDFSDIKDFEDHVAFHASPQSKEIASFMFSSEIDVGSRQIPSLLVEKGNDAMNLKNLVTKLSQQGLSVYGVDVTTPDISDIGLYVARAVIPELQRLNSGYRYRYLGGKRIYEMPHLLGLTEGVLSFEDVTPYPHPFP